MRQVCDFLMVLLLIAAMSMGVLMQPPAAHFDSSAELSDFLVSRGFLIRHGKAPSEPYFSFFFSDHAVGDDEFAQLSFCTDCGLSPKWKGIVRVDQLHSSIGELEPTSISGKIRICGNVLLAGDEELMDRVLQAVREFAPNKIR
jgi:hypothetical protein